MKLAGAMNNTHSDSSYFIPFEEYMDVLTLGLKVNAKDTRVIVDTGARIDYMDPSLLDTSNSIGHESDYNPILCHFEVDGYKTTYGIGDKEFETTTYGATDMLKNYVLSIGIRGVSGVVGLNSILMKVRGIAVKYEKNQIILIL